VSKLICAEVKEIFRNLCRSFCAEVHPCRSSVTWLTDVRNNQLLYYIMFGKNLIYSEHLCLLSTWVNVPNIKPVLFRIYVPKLNCSEHTNSQITSLWRYSHVHLYLIKNQKLSVSKYFSLFSYKKSSFSETKIQVEADLYSQLLKVKFLSKGSVFHYFAWVFAHCSPRGILNSTCYESSVLLICRVEF